MNSKLHEGLMGQNLIGKDTCVVDPVALGVKQPQVDNWLVISWFMLTGPDLADCSWKP